MLNNSYSDYLAAAADKQIDYVRNFRRFAVVYSMSRSTDIVYCPTYLYWRYISSRSHKGVLVSLGINLIDICGPEY